MKKILTLFSAALVLILGMFSPAQPGVLANREYRRVHPNEFVQAGATFAQRLYVALAVRVESALALIPGLDRARFQHRTNLLTVAARWGIYLPNQTFGRGQFHPQQLQRQYGSTYNPNDVHIQKALNDLAIKYSNAEVIWRQVMPPKKVDKRSDKYFIYDKANAFQKFDDTLAPNALPNEASWKLSNDNYSVTDHGLSSWMPLEAVENADDPLDPMGDEVESISEVLDNQQEARVAAKVFTAANYPAGNKVTLSGTSQWSDYANSDPLAVIEDAADGLLTAPNVLVLGADTWRVMRRHPRVTAKLFPLGGNASVAGSSVTLKQLADYLADFGIEKVLVGRRRVNTANPGQTPVLARAWGKHASLLRVVENPGNKVLTWGATFMETERNVYQETDQKRGVKGSVFTKVAWNSDEKIIASDAGYFFENAVA